MTPVPRILVKCSYCGKQFETMECKIKGGGGKYCSRACANLAMVNHTIAHCEVCGAAFKRYKSNPRKRFCSKKCMGIGQIGHHRKKKTGVTKKCSFCGKAIYVQKCSVKEHNFCSQKCQIKFYLPSRSGEKNQNFINGATISRDGYALTFDNERKRVPSHRLIAEKAIGRELHCGEVVHHIDENKLNNESSNLLVCTISYHTFLHHKMRREGFNIG
jgi:endogenous inhibitor of DNA gyrase (YacG/DUF329 family)